MSNAASQPLFNVRVRVTTEPGISSVRNVRVHSTNANRAKGLAALQVQQENPGRAVDAVDVWELS